MTASETAATFSGLVDLASHSLGGRAVATSDDFFAGMGALVMPGRGIFLPDEYTEDGKWMDGWESRRRRGGGDQDWCIVALGAAGRIRALDIDTHHFLGNHPPYAALDVCHMPADATEADLVKADWVEILEQSPLRAGAQNLFTATTNEPVSHVRLRIFPDGGVARLRVYGEVEPSWESPFEMDVTKAQIRDDEVDLVGIQNGGRALACSDMFFSPMRNLILPKRAENMGEGWETRRKRQPGHDWIMLKLGARGKVAMAVIDTHLFKGNFPDCASIDGIDAAQARITDLTAESAEWKPLLSSTKLNADERIHVRDLHDVGSITHVRLNIFPDGGISRMRLYGHPDKIK